MEVLQANTSLPLGPLSPVQLSFQSKIELYTDFDNTLFRDSGDQLRFSWPGDYSLAGEFEDQMRALHLRLQGRSRITTIDTPS